MCRFAAVILACIALVSGQPALKFGVASIKPSQPGDLGGGIRPAPGGERYVASNITLKQMITVAYRIKADQVAGGPAWLDDDRYDMNAKAERPSSLEELHAMLQDLLADRFKLRFHRESKELPMYALTVDKDGPKLKPHEARSAGDPWIDQTQDHFPQTTWHATFAPMDYFAWRLSTILDRPVVDQTDLKGGYDFDLKFTQELPPQHSAGGSAQRNAIDTSGPTIFDAIRRQLGLKLERQKGPVDILVIDQAVKPVEN